MNNKPWTICIVGLGYVGLPIAIAFSRKFKVIGFDISKKRISSLQEGIDLNQEVSYEDINNSNIKLTNSLEDAQNANIFIVTVPTPIDKAKKPNLKPLKEASRMISEVLKKGDIVIYESTVYPGVTEDICVPILESNNSMKINKDFSVGYSPERINPSDKINTLNNIIKVISASNQQTLSILKELYGAIIEKEIYPVSSIKVAEMCKVIENSQRDINVGFINEVSIICDHLNIETNEVLNAAKTKWNFLDFSPGLVGGHCIGVDPYYLAKKANDMGCEAKVILAGRSVNDQMGFYVAHKAIKIIMNMGTEKISYPITIFGATFKENCSDLRNSLVIDIYKEIKNYGLNVQIIDPVSGHDALKDIYGDCAVKEFDQLKPSYCLIVAVKHDCFVNIKIDSFLKKDAHILDIKNLFNKTELYKKGYNSWRL